MNKKQLKKKLKKLQEEHEDLMFKFFVETLENIPEDALDLEDEFEDVMADDEHFHELMDRIHIIQCTINDHLLDHPAATSGVQQELMHIQNMFTRIYQWASEAVCEE